MDFDYKKYSLENLENWMHDALSSAEASPQEIYNVIKSVVDENYHIHKLNASRCYELLALLNGNGKGHIKKYDDYLKSKPLACDKDDSSPECKKSWTSFWEESNSSKQYSGSSVSSVSDIMPPWGHSDMEALRYTEEELNAMCDAAEKKVKMSLQGSGENEDGFFIDQDKVKKWVLPVEMDGPSGEYFLSFPDDLLEAANLKEGDQVEWIDQSDGSYLFRKVLKTHDKMTDD